SGKLYQHCGCVTCRRTNQQYLVVLGKLRNIQQATSGKRCIECTPLANAYAAIRISHAPRCSGHEIFASNIINRCNDSMIVDIAGAQLADDHSLAHLFEIFVTHFYYLWYV